MAIVHIYIYIYVLDGIFPYEPSRYWGIPMDWNPETPPGRHNTIAPGYVVAARGAEGGRPDSAAGKLLSGGLSAHCPIFNGVLPWIMVCCYGFTIGLPWF